MTDAPDRREEIKPALSKEEWAQWNADDSHIVLSTTSPKLGYCIVLGREIGGMTLDIHGPPPPRPLSRGPMKSSRVRRQ